MMPKIRLCIAMCMVFALAACTFGNGMICGPQTPRAYCDSSAYEKLAHPKPYIELWEKAGASEGQRAIDWVECGGASNGDFSPAIARLKEEKRPEESGRDAAYFRLQEKLKHCMVAKDYRYMGKIRVTPEQ